MEIAKVINKTDIVMEDGTLVMSTKPVEYQGFLEKRGKWGIPAFVRQWGVGHEFWTNSYVTLRVFGPSDPSEWELLVPDGTLIKGWHLKWVGRDHSRRYSLHVTFDRFNCVNAEGQKVDVHLSWPPSQMPEKESPLSSARTHRLAQKWWGNWAEGRREGREESHRVLMRTWAPNNGAEPCRNSPVRMRKGRWCSYRICLSGLMNAWIKASEAKYFFQSSRHSSDLSFFNSL